MNSGLCEGLTTEITPALCYACRSGANRGRKRVPIVHQMPDSRFDILEEQ